MRSTPTNRMVAFGVALALPLCIGTLIKLLPLPKVTQLDTRFEVLHFKISRGTNHGIYEGNQLEGQVRSGLRCLGLNVKGLPQSVARTGRDSVAVMIRYTGDFAHQDLQNLKAELRDESGYPLRLRWLSGSCDQKTSRYTGIWAVDSDLLHSGTYYLRLRLPANDTCLASIRVGKL